MTREASARLTWFIAGLGLLATLGLSLAYGVQAGASGALGAAVALANWFALRVLVDRIVGGSVKQQAGVALLLIGKMGGLMALAFVLLKSGWVQILPFTVGVSSLMAGALLGSLVHVLTAPAVESER